MAMLLIESRVSTHSCTQYRPPPRPAPFHSLLKAPSLEGVVGRSGLREGMAVVSKALDGQGGTRAAARAALAAEPPPPKALVITSVLNLLFATPPPEECSWEGGTGNSHLGGGFAGLKHLGLVAHCWRGQGCGASQCLLLSYGWRGGRG